MRQLSVMLAMLLILCPQAIAAEERNPEADRQHFERVLQRNSRDLAALYHLGQYHRVDGHPERAIVFWKRLSELAPQDWKIREQLVQVYSASGDYRRRQMEIDNLLDMHKSEAYPELSKRPFFMRDLFKVGEKRVFVFDYFDQNPDWKFGPMFWKFYVEDSEKVSTMFISLGSYTVLNEMLHKSGELKEGQKTYHLDGYWTDGKHATYGFFDEGMPNYEVIKQQVIEIIKGNQKSISSMTPKDGKQVIEILK